MSLTVLSSCRVSRHVLSYILYPQQLACNNTGSLCNLLSRLDFLTKGWSVALAENGRVCSHSSAFNVLSGDALAA